MNIKTIIESYEVTCEQAPKEIAGMIEKDCPLNWVAEFALTQFRSMMQRYAIVSAGIEFDEERDRIRGLTLDATRAILAQLVRLRDDLPPTFPHWEDVANAITLIERKSI